MIAAPTLSVEAALAELQEVAPDAPFLALGQTVFWDEPMKAGILLKSLELGYSRRLVAGVHDTDYFAKHAGKGEDGKYRAVPHNDTTTRDLWSAVGEFSTLFGSETVITREALAAAGLNLRKVARSRPAALDEATEAWGWRGIVAVSDESAVAAEVPLRELFPVLRDTFFWAVDTTKARVNPWDPAGVGRDAAEKLKTLLCDLADHDPTMTVSRYYQKLLPELYRYCSDSSVDIDVSATTDLLRFNTETFRLPRFDIVRCFVDEETREEACRAYDEALEGSEMYGLARFGTGAIPFDLFIPGHGRGTLRIGRRGAVIMTPKPVFLSFKKPLCSLDALAAAITAKFGPDCVLVGKAVTLIGMLAREFVFVFHEGASSYVDRSRQLFQKLARDGCPLDLHPILRVRYNAWDALAKCCSWLRLPEPLQRPFGVEELCAPSFAGRRREVGEQQKALLAHLGALRRPIDLIRYLDQTCGGCWSALAAEYEQLHNRLDGLTREVAAIKDERMSAIRLLRDCKRRRVEAERAKGEHFRARIFERDATPEDLIERERLTHAVEDAIEQVRSTKLIIRSLLQSQTELVSAAEVIAVHERRRAIELEAEIKRLGMAREAVIASKGLSLANRRPSAWWFPIVCPGGTWFRATIDECQCYLEPLTA
jgi:hypothetical protein